MPALSKKPFLKNYMEDVVWSFLPNVLAKYPDACHCEICQHDIVAIALNLLPPRYVVREQGEIYTKLHTLEIQYRADIYTALTKAIMTVTANPRHDDNTAEEESNAQPENSEA
ncbi:MAG TPA: late competence development ComFB family protein [Clostridia bacterium]|nr:late competence development ComFB family protein [Clostridia bacterium]